MTPSDVGQLGSQRCPIPWARAVRSNLKQHTRREQAVIEPWLRANGWRYEDCPRFGPTWWDPLTGIDWSLRGAVQRQAVREAQPLLAPRGWKLAMGAKFEGTWTWADRVRQPRRRPVSLLTALRSEGIDTSMPAKGTP